MIGIGLLVLLDSVTASIGVWDSYYEAKSGKKEGWRLNSRDILRNHTRCVISSFRNFVVYIENYKSDEINFISIFNNVYNMHTVFYKVQKALYKILI